MHIPSFGQPKSSPNSVSHETVKTANKDENPVKLQAALEDLVQPGSVQSVEQAGKTDSCESDAHSYQSQEGGSKRGWLAKFFDQDDMNKLFASEHMGNFVIVRSTGERIFEEMPIYVRIGMHLLFVTGHPLMSQAKIEKLLLAQSVKQGQTFDAMGPQVLPHIQSFVDQFGLPLSDLLEPDLSKYNTFNEFFYRKLRADARPIASPSDPAVVVSQADCRLTVWQCVEDATRIWIKGKQFTIPALLGSEAFASTLGPSPAVAVFRLAPQDYHRFHTPVSGTLGKSINIPGKLYTVNPQAINEDLDVFTENSRSVLPIHLPSGQTVYVVAVGAMLVGSINWTHTQEGTKVEKGDELGWFAYGGSTVILVTPTGSTTWDEDIRRSSEQAMETMVRVGERIGGLN
ncbi:Phosphatidylserine decarboxylase [Phaffia rhodozyma]|uniref:phosphatidylserine decarboxylase n=1 Tax=Phaffia rhodozyma TaxID=264483 RepID=A0A0F7SED6_PHARH|nr:Phosphatidylserine decarboxylase [Phaffia rhodozyma]